MPTNTDLVTDLPADFAVFGQAVDTSMADLKGGTTGQILSKATNTDMDFTWITNDVGDITAVTATSPLTGGGTSGAITVGIQDATTSVKGSVQLSDSTSTTSSVLAATPTAVKSAYDLAAAAYAAGFTNSYPAGKNRVLNASMNVWQRGTTSADSVGNPYTADRWQLFRSSVAGATVSRQATSDTTNLPFIQYCARVQRTAANTSTNTIYFSQSMESLNSIPLAGKTVVVSFYARKGANYSSASDAMAGVLVSGTGTDENVRTGFTGQATVTSTTATLTTTWQRFTMTGTVAATATQLAVYFNNTPVGTAGAADYYEITGVQLEVGSTASPYAPNSTTYQGELAACQRYYWRTSNPTAYALHGNGIARSTTEAQTMICHPISMRIAPTSVEFSTLGITDAAAFISAISAITISQASSQTTNVYTSGSSSLVLSRSYFLGNNNSTSGYIAFNAEL